MTTRGMVPHAALAFVLAIASACEQNVTEVTLLMEEFRFEPSQVTVSGRTPLRLRVVNHGHEAHEFLVPSLFPDAVRIDPGRTVEILVTPPPGTYAFRCRIRGHGGMDGTLIVAS